MENRDMLERIENRICDLERELDDIKGSLGVIIRNQSRSYESNQKQSPDENTIELLNTVKRIESNLHDQRKWIWHAMIGFGKLALSTVSRKTTRRHLRAQAKAFLKT